MQTTLYLKYRPDKISDLDLTEVREMMTKMLSGFKSGKTDKLPHAWLFSGPRGTGKTSTARILSKILNCEKRIGFEPCNECFMCRDISSGVAVDITEIDAASNRGIDEIRGLKERIGLAPMRGKVKVYIIDEVHMLTTEAANALLKTLEEPPENTYFFLCTTEAEKLPETVVSRCTRVVFRKPNTDEAVASMQRVVIGEEMKATKEALIMLVKAARGSFRDGTKFLEQVFMTAGEVTEESVKDVLGVITISEVAEYTDAIEKGDTKTALDTIGKLESQGTNFRRFVEMTAEVWRDKLIAAADKDASGDAGLYLRLLGGLDEVYEQMKTSVIVQLPLEMFTVKLGGVSDTGNGKDVIPQKDRKTVKEVEEIKPVENVKKPEVKTTKEDKEEEKPVEDINDNQEAPQQMAPGQFSLEDLEGRWVEVLKAVRPKNHSVEALLRSTRPVAFNGERIELEVFYKFHKDKLETDKCRFIVENAVAEMFGVAKVRLYLKLGVGRKKKEDVTAEGVGEDIVKAAEEIFGAEAV